MSDSYQVGENVSLLLQVNQSTSAVISADYVFSIALPSGTCMCRYHLISLNNLDW